MNDVNTLTGERRKLFDSLVDCAALRCNRVAQLKDQRFADVAAGVAGEVIADLIGGFGIQVLNEIQTRRRQIKSRHLELCKAG